MDVNSINGNVQPLAAAAPVAPVEQPAEHREIIQAVKAVNATEMFGKDNVLQYQMDRKTHRMLMQVVNRKTQEVVSQVPPEYILRLAEDLKSA